MNQNVKIGLGAVVVLVGLAAAWYLISPLFFDNSVDEAFPLDLPTVQEAANMSATDIETAVNSAMSSVDSLTDDEMVQVEERLLDLAAQMPDSEMDEAMPAANEPIILSQGQFEDADAFHQGEGSATIYTLADGSNLLRFEAFNVTNGPDLHVILSTNPNPTGRDDIGEYVDLGSLKGNVGNQNYEIPADVDLSLYQSIVIYCQPFHVVFSTATLN